MKEKSFESARAKGHEFFRVHSGGLWSAMMVKMCGGKERIEQILTTKPEGSAVPSPTPTPPAQPAAQPRAAGGNP